MEAFDGLDGGAAIIVFVGHTLVGVLKKDGGHAHFAAGIVCDREYGTISEEMRIDGDTELPLRSLGDDRADIGVCQGATCWNDLAWGAQRLVGPYLLEVRGKNGEKMPLATLKQAVECVVTTVLLSKSFRLEDFTSGRID